MSLRNIAPKDGLCNGTRLMVVRCASRIIEALILSGEKFSNLAFIPRITLIPSSSEFPFRTTRRQFPIRLAYALTINKSQGQSVKFVGVDLRTAVFSHGQLYVALSRCTSFDRISVLLSKVELDSTTKYCLSQSVVINYVVAKSLLRMRDSFENAMELRRINMNTLLRCHCKEVTSKLGRGHHHQHQQYMATTKFQLSFYYWTLEFMLLFLF
ncbi:uncharacterized protein LOC131308122 isoform X2 [Rhododendron vialii]|nr:uncharacterized protein LOC131308122 isoform X2 [Rhododendron vialii]